MSSQTPASLGFRMPAEWDKHSGTMLSWPCNPETWPGERLDRVEKVFTRIVQEVTKREHLHLIINDDATLERAAACLGALIQDSARITLHKRTSNDLWARDFGPIFVRNQISGMYAITDWEYNAWGGKYPPFDSDNGVPGWFSAKYGIQRFKPGIVLEGGSIETNGDGVMLTTESVLLNPNRNPDLSKAQIEQYLKDWLGQENVIWLKNGLAGDDTDGHIDDLSRFLDSRTIMTMVTDDKDDVNYETLQENYELLKSATDQRGEPFEIVTVPMPQTRVEETTVDGSEHVPASYANFYFVNGAVLLPVYDPRYDEQVITLFKKHLPDHEIVAIPCADLVWGQGSIHCISQQLYGL
ncbi:MAG: agmatine deiminase family protein [Candidatus Cyclonatronum sp.]|uniref:agmatine deiminase family protein n=1 Tax=Cyclonatronum sp. TaxID=3024185 RepID=UPI0025BD8CB1|nr:agmatine deiminase family protein [Cyclonatronum sp.]MCH8485660.1 agmatine deiminase family protein [Cyclonatronum sp.]